MEELGARAPQESEGNTLNGVREVRAFLLHPSSQNTGGEWSWTSPGIK